MNLLFYLLKVNIVLSVFYLFYVLLFRNDTFFTAKRIMLICFLLIAFIFPVADFSFLFRNSYPDFSGIGDVINLDEIIIQSGTIETSDSLLVPGLLVIVLSGSFLYLSRSIVQIVTYAKRINQSEKIEINGVSVRVLKGQEAPFSFFGQIVLDPEKHTSGELNEIIIHERVHVLQRHFLDVILCNILYVVCWYNPLARLIAKEIKMNLEYSADRIVASSGCDIRHYQMHLLRLSCQKNTSRILNNFTVSPLKNRIVMMNKKHTSLFGMVKYMFVVPLIAGLIFAHEMQAGNENFSPESLSNLIVTGYSQSKDSVKQQSLKTVEISREEGVLDKADEIPLFPGGVDELMNYLSSNIRYPENAAKNGIQGTVICRFIVRSTGHVDKPEVMRSVDQELDNEAVRVVAGMPQWEPGKVDGKPVDVYFTIPISFRLNDEAVSPNSGNPIPENVLFLLDGKKISREEMSKLSSDDIESIDVQKDKVFPDGKKGAIISIKTKQ